jgi:hypothetical protein
MGMETPAAAMVATAAVVVDVGSGIAWRFLSGFVVLDGAAVTLADPQRAGGKLFRHRSSLGLGHR